jgi:hypothetical protein
MSAMTATALIRVIAPITMVSHSMHRFWRSTTVELREVLVDADLGMADEVVVLLDEIVVGEAIELGDGLALAGSLIEDRCIKRPGHHFASLASRLPLSTRRTISA